jgi:hypothetical protein
MLASSAARVSAISVTSAGSGVPTGKLIAASPWKPFFTVVAIARAVGLPVEALCEVGLPAGL